MIRNSAGHKDRIYFGGTMINYSCPKEMGRAAYIPGRDFQVNFR